MRILGIDPALRSTGWGVIEIGSDNTLHHIAHGTILVPSNIGFDQRLAQLFTKIDDAIDSYKPDEVAIEEVFVNMNPGSTLKLGMARGVAMVVPARKSIPVHEYSANFVKKAIVGNGHATKDQMIAMVGHFLPKAKQSGKDIQSDAADALAVAICHAHSNHFSRKVRA